MHDADLDYVLSLDDQGRSIKHGNPPQEEKPIPISGPERKKLLQKKLKVKIQEVKSQARSLNARIEMQREKEGYYVNPNIWKRLLGRQNTVEAIAEGMPCKVLLDTGAQITLISEAYCIKRGLPIKPIAEEDEIEFSAANGSDMEYVGVTHFQLEFPDHTYSENIPALVVPHILYHNFVPITIGTLTLEHIFDHCKVHDDLDSLPKEWQLVNQAIIWRRQQQDKVLGTARTIKAHRIPAHSTFKLPTYLKASTGGQAMHCIAEPLQRSKLPEGLSFDTSLYVDIQQGSKRVHVIIQNTTDETIELPAKTSICNLSLANLVPKLVADPKDFTVGDINQSFIPEDFSFLDSEDVLNTTQLFPNGKILDRTLSHLLDAAKPSPIINQQVNTNQEEGSSPSTEPDASWLFDMLDLSGIQDWPPDLQKQARDLFIKHQNLFSKDDMDLGRTNLVKHKIVLTDPEPFKEKFRSIPPQLYSEVRNHLNEMLKLGAIRKSCSPWASAIVLVRKKNGKLRFCIDLRKLNARTKKDSYALPRIEQTLDHLKGSSIFSTLDLTSGYWQVEMEEECKQFTAFTVGPLGFYECNLMPFGATNAPATFQRLMEDVLGDLNLNWCIVYLDDVIIFASSPQQHLERLAAVFNKLSAAGLKLKPSKCSFFQKDISYLGHHISEEGIATDAKKIQAVQEWPTPTTVSEVRSFLGFVGYYRRFIKGFSAIARPLTDLTKGLESQSKKIAKKTKVQWGEKEEESFQTLKEACTSTPILGFPDYTLPFILHTDASTFGLGAVLYQKQKDGTRVIAYASRSLSRSEANYTPHKLEFLALKWAITEKFKDYLYGGNIFDCYTDNNPLTYILSSAKLDACGQRWVAELASYNFNLHYKSGATNIEADCLSRIEWPDVLNQTDESRFQHLPYTSMQAIIQGISPQIILADSIILNKQVIPVECYVANQPGLTKEDWKQLQSADPTLSMVIKHLREKTWNNRKKPKHMPIQLKLYYRVRKNLVFKEGILYKKNCANNAKGREHTLQLLLPRKLIPEVLQSCHDDMGHQGRQRTLSLVRERFFWPRMYTEVISYVTSCKRCQHSKATPHVAPMMPIQVSQPLELVHMDFLSLEKCKGEFENVLIVTDHYTRYAQAYPCKNQTAYTTARVFWEQFVRHYGWPQKIISDQGRNFESQLMKDLCKIAGVDKIRTTPYHPQCNGVCERFNSTLMNMLKPLPEAAKADWKSHLLTMCHAYNCTVHSSTSYSPYYLMFHRHPRIALDFKYGLTKEGVKSSSKCRYIQKLRRRIAYAHKRAEEVAAKEAKRQKARYDRRCRGMQLHTGDIVLVKVVAWKDRHKIQDRWEQGEYVIIDQPNPDIPVYTVKPVDADLPVRTLHRNLLLPLGVQMKGNTIPTDSLENIETEDKGIVLLSDTVISPSPVTPKERHESILKKSDVNQQETIEEGEDLIILEDTDDNHPLVVNSSDNSFSILDSWKYSNSDLFQEESTEDTSIHQLDKPMDEDNPIEMISLLEEEDNVPEVKKLEPVRRSKRTRKPPVRFAQVSDMPEDLQKTMIDVMLSLPIGVFPTEEGFQYIPITPEGNPILGLSSQKLL